MADDKAAAQQAAMVKAPPTDKPNVQGTAGQQTQSPPAQPKPPAPPAQVDIAAIMAKPIEDLSMDELRIRLKQMEKLGAAPSPISRDDMAGVGPDDDVYIDVPLSPENKPYKINEKAYGPGKVKVSFRVARQLSSMVASTWQREKERLISRGNKMNGALLRGEELTKIERFQQIMKED